MPSGVPKVKHKGEVQVFCMSLYVLPNIIKVVLVGFTPSPVIILSSVAMGRLEEFSTFVDDCNEPGSPVSDAI